MANQPGAVLTDPTQMFHLALTDAGIPIDGVAMLTPLEITPVDGVTTSVVLPQHIVVRADGLVVDISYRPEATEEQIVEGNEIVMTLDVSPRRVRTAWAIYADIAALSNKQKDNIAADLKADGGAKVKSFGPPYDAIMMALDWAAETGTVIQTRDAYARIAALYTQQNIYYLETPAFDSTINISGGEIIPPEQVPASLRFTPPIPSNPTSMGMG